jgi:TatA/E family protein of Tat protein translocase
MLAGPDLLVVLGIAFIVIGPKKLPELAKAIGKALAEFKKTTEEIKDSIGIKELGGIRSSLTGMDLLTDLAEKVSASMAKEGPGQSTGPVEVLTPVGNGERLEKGNNDKLDGVREQMPGRGIPS